MPACTECARAPVRRRAQASESHGRAAQAGALPTNATKLESTKHYSDTLHSTQYISQKREAALG
eukprot:1120923-Pleurochrysis_carterae.AAC.2